MDKLIFSHTATSQQGAYQMQQITNELSNISSVGFKRSFANVNNTLKVEGPGFSTRFTTEVDNRDTVSLAGGKPMYTGNPMDVAMNGHTVLGVSAPNGDLAFTRRGDLRINSTGLVVDGTGNPVRGQGGQISAPAGYLINITEDGSLFAKSPSAPKNTPATAIGRLMLRDASTTKLDRRQDGLFQARNTDPSQQDITNGKEIPSVSPGSLESSGVNAVDGLIKMIAFQRSFENSIRMIKEAKSIDESGATTMKSA